MASWSLLLALMVTINGPATASSGTCDGLVATLVGTSGNDVITGTVGPDVIDAGDGDDVVFALDGSDVVCGGDGSDVIFAGDGNDVVWGDGPGGTAVTTGDSDVLLGQGGSDILMGEGGDDLVWGAAGADHLEGGDGNDMLHGAAGGDTLIGGEGDDTIFGWRGDDSAEGGDGSDYIDGGPGDDDLKGNDGSDIVNGATGDDVVDLGNGDDSVRGGPGRDFIQGGDGDDVIRGGPGDDELGGDDGDDYILGRRGDDLIIGSSGDDILDGDSGIDVIEGGPGADLVRGGSDDDVLFGDNAADLLFGGRGNDIGDGGPGVDLCRSVEVPTSCAGLALPSPTPPPPGDRPVAFGKFARTSGDAIDITLRGVDIDKGALEFTIDGTNTAGTVRTARAGGKDTETFTYTPSSGFSGVDTFSFTVSSGGETSTPAHVFVVVGLAPAQPAIDVEKSTNGVDADTSPGPSLTEGDAVTWSYVVTNTGDADLTGVTVTDDQLGSVTCPMDTLPAGESMICTATGTAQYGQYGNTGTAVGTAPNGVVVTDSDDSHYLGLSGASIDLEKSTNGIDADTAPGPSIQETDVVSWDYVITNDGVTGLSNIALEDDQLGAITCPATTLAAGASMTCSVIGVAGVGQYANVGEVTAIDINGVAVSDSDPSHYFGVAINPSISVEKDTNGDDADAAPGPTLTVGDTVTWTYVVTNTGDSTLFGVSLEDDQLGSIVCPQVSLPVGDSMTCAATGVVAVGQYANLATATATAANGALVSDTDPSHYFGIAPEMSIEKATNGHDADTAPGPSITEGSVVQWTYRVTNSGDTALTSVTVTDDQGVSVSCPKNSLSPGESMTCSGSGTATPGQYANVGTAEGTASNGTVVSATDPSHYFGVALNPDITIEKATNGHDADSAPGPSITEGDAVSWTYLVTNTGDTVLSTVDVTDDQGITVSCPKSTLAVGESMTCSASGTATPGQYANVGTAEGTASNGTVVSDTDPSHYFGVALVPDISIEKSTNGHDADTAPGPTLVVGSVVQWTYRVTNSGDTPLTGVGVTDDQGETVSCPKSTLAVGESISCFALGNATAGQYANVGTAEGTASNGALVSDSDPSHYFGEVPVAVDFKLRINGVDAADKTDVDVPRVDVGVPLTFSYQVSNTGPGDLGPGDITIDHASNSGLESVVAAGVTQAGVTGPTGDDGDGVLEQGETWTYSRSANAIDLTSETLGVYVVDGACPYTDVTGAPATMLAHRNEALLDGPTGVLDDEAHYCNRLVDLEVQLEATPEDVVAGLPFTYTATVTNYGPDAANNVVFLDLLPARCQPGSVGPLGLPCPVMDQTDPPFGGTFRAFPEFGDVSVSMVNDVGDAAFQIDNPDIAPFSERQKAQGATFDSVSATDGAGCFYDAGVHGVFCDLTILGSGDSFTVTISMTMDPFARVRVWNRAWVTSDETDSGQEPNTIKEAGQPCGNASNTNGWPADPTETFPQPAGPGCNYAKKNVRVSATAHIPR